MTETTRTAIIEYTTHDLVLDLIAPHGLSNAELLARFLTSREATCTPNSIATYRATLTPFIDWLRDQPLDPDIIRAYLAYVKERGVSETHQHNSYRLVKTLCRWMVDEEFLARDPFTGKRRVMPTRRTRQHRTVYSEADVIKLLIASKPTAWNKRNPDLKRERWSAGGPMEREALQARALVVLAMDSALRATEICSLTCGAIRAAEPVVTGKGGHTLPFFMSEPTRQLMAELARERPDSDPLFLNWDGNKCQHRDLRTLLRRLARRANVVLPPRPLHAWRHYAARQWKAAGLGDLSIKDLMRHNSLSTTEIYTGGPDVISLTRQHAAASPVTRLLAQAGLI